MRKKSKALYIFGSALIGICLLLTIYLILIGSGAVQTRRNLLVFKACDVSKEYDGTPLVCDSYELIDGRLKNGHRVSAKFSGEQTEIGRSESDVIITVYDENGADVTDNYQIECRRGTLEVKGRLFSLKSYDYEKTFDGKTIGVSDYGKYMNPAGDLFAGDTLDIAFEDKTYRDCGEYQNYFTARIRDSKGNDVSAKYDLQLEFGIISIKKCPLSVYSGDAEKVYDGTELTNSYWYVTGERPDGYSVDCSVNGTITDVKEGGVPNSFSYIRVKNAAGKDESENFEITEFPGTLNIIGIPVTVATGGASKLYDGTPLTCPDYMVSGKPLDGHSYKVKVTGSIVRGQADNTAVIVFTDAKGNDKTGNYDIRYEFGTLIVEGGYDVTLPTGKDANLTNRFETPSERIMFEIVSDVTGTLYLQDCNYGNYNGNGWDVAPYHAGANKSLLLPYMLMEAAKANADGGKAIGANVRFSKYGSVPLGKFVPAYPIRYMVGENGEENGYSYSIYYYEDLYKYAESYKDVFVSREYADFEEEYRKFVYDNYLYVPDSTANALNGTVIKDFLTVSKCLSKAAAIEAIKKLLSNYTYNSEAESYPENEDQVVYFLTKSKEGICQQFASSGVVLLRMLGIPARYVTGYAPSVNKANETVLVNNMEAHAWAEVYFDNVGWVQVEFTVGDGNGLGNHADKTGDMGDYGSGSGGAGGGGSGSDGSGSDGLGKISDLLKPDLSDLSDISGMPDFSGDSDLPEFPDISDLPGTSADLSDEDFDKISEWLDKVLDKIGSESGSGSDGTGGENPDGDFGGIGGGGGSGSGGSGGGSGSGGSGGSGSGGSGSGGDIGDGAMDIEFGDSLDVPGEGNSGGGAGGGGGSPSPIMYVTTDIGGDIFLWGAEYGKYAGKWQKTAKYASEIRPNGFVSLALINGGYSKGTLSVEYIENVSLPEMFLLYQNAGAVKTKKGCSVEYYYADVQADGAVLSLGITAAEAISDEKDYSDFVYNNYLGVSESVKNAISSVFADIGLVKYNAKPDNYQIQNAIEIIKKYLQTNYLFNAAFEKYPDDTDPIVYFLTGKDKQGTGFHFASAAALLLQTAGIPARFCSGYAVSAAAGTRTAVTIFDETSWTEVYFDKIGWVRVDFGTGEDVTPPIDPADEDNEIGKPDAPGESIGDIDFEDPDGGSGDGDFEDPENPGDIETKTLLYATSNASGDMYLLGKTRGDFINNAWQKAPEYTGSYSVDPWLYTTLTLLAANRKESEVLIEYAEGNTSTNRLAPSYFNGYLDAAGGYKAKYVNFDRLYNWSNFSLISIPKQYAAEEAAYREFVYNNYLYVDDETRMALQSLIKSLGLDFNGVPTTEQKVAAIQKLRKMFSSEFKYDLNRKTAPDGKNKIVYFLTEGDKRGICGDFAGAGTILLRLLGIPARRCDGFFVKTASGKRTPVTTQNGHAWTEVYFDNIGWVTVEFTVASPADNNDDQTVAKTGWIILDTTAGTETVSKTFDSAFYKGEISFDKMFNSALFHKREETDYIKSVQFELTQTEERNKFYCKVILTVYDKDGNDVTKYYSILQPIAKMGIVTVVPD